MISSKLIVNNIPIKDDFSKNLCWARLSKDPTKQCKCKPKLGSNFCGRHIKKANSGNIKTIYDIVNIDKKKKKLIIKKKKSFVRNDCIIDRFTIIKLQSYIRMFNVKKNIFNRGIACYCRKLCNNDTDCLSFDKIIDIQLNDIFTYKDKNNIYWGFKISTFKELLKMNMTNPYSTIEFPKDIKEKFNTLLKNIEKNKKIEIKKEKITDKNIQLQQKCIDIFQKMDNLKNYTKCEWFLSLNIIQLKELYKQMEDLWNYRLNLNHSQKLKYVSDGKLFTISVSKFSKLSSKFKASEILLNEFNRLVSEGQTESDRATACQWILSGLTLVNLDARNSLPWLFQSANVY